MLLMLLLTMSRSFIYCNCSINRWVCQYYQ